MYRERESFLHKRPTGRAGGGPRFAGAWELRCGEPVLGKNICMPIYMSIYLSVYLCLSLSLSIYIYIYIHIYIYIYIYIYISCWAQACSGRGRTDRGPRKCTSKILVVVVLVTTDYSNHDNIMIVYV